MYIRINFINSVEDDMSEIDVKIIWHDLRNKLMDKPLEDMTALEVTERLGIFKFISFKADKEAELLQNEVLKIMDFKAQQDIN
jgi:hypothetical protein